MRNVALYFLSVLIILFIGWFGNDFYRLKVNNQTPNPISVIKPRPLEKYAIENLSQALPPKADIKIEEAIKEEESYSTYLFSISFDPTLSGKEKKKVAGLINIPKGEGPFPLIVMFRGYVDQKQFVSGMGTQRMGEFLAENGFITLAPDFLGYGKSDSEAANIFESRFQTYTTALTVINSVSSIKEFDGENIFIWGHSNGGQIALTVLEITQKEYPTVLWAPVSRPFPYSILYYTDESDDKGKLIRRELAKFEEDYDVEKFSLTNYLDRIKAKISLHQGTADDAIPRSWTNALSKSFPKENIEYFIYPGADHNLQPSWNLTAQRTLSFFRENLK